jgi:uncharacterized short protein YbdD (DUF466 family)
VRRAWGWLRELAGDDAYERYCAHQARCHPGGATLDRHAFYRQELERRWSGVSRCC